MYAARLRQTVVLETTEASDEVLVCSKADTQQGVDNMANGSPTDNSLDSVEQLDTHNKMERGLSNRHVQFIAIGGTIGTGLFLGSGKSIALTGPSIVLVYIVVGLVMFILMRAIGELMYNDPSQHTFINFITKYVGKGWGYFAQWSYWIVLVLIGMTELTAVSKYFVEFFRTYNIDLSSWKWLIEIAFLAVLVLINLIAVKAFGEAEFWFAMIKITLIIGMIVTAIVMLIIHYRYPAVSIRTTNSVISSPAGEVSLANIFRGFSIAPHGWYNFAIAFPMVFFAYQLIEFVGVTVSETKNPRPVLKKATNQIIYRILIFYVGALIAIMTIVPWRNFVPDKTGEFVSPFIMVFKYAGIDWAAALVFFVVITAASSSLNSLLFSAGRHLYQVANESQQGSVLRFFSLEQVSGHKVPARAILMSGLFILLSPAVSLFPAVTQAFTWFSSASSAVIIGIYILTVIAHWKYRSSSDFTADGFLMPAYKIFDALAIAFFILIYISLFMAADTVWLAVGGLVWFTVFGVWSHFRVRSMQERHTASL